MSEPKPFDIDRLFEGSLLRLRAEAEYFSRLTDHNPEVGRLNETHLVKLLRDYLPPKIGLGTGFVRCGGSEPRQSPQCDIILYDALNNAPLYKSDAWSIYPIEMVYGVIEVKTTLNAKELSDCFVKCAKIRAMAKGPDGKGNKAYLLLQPKDGVAGYAAYSDPLPPRFFVFAYGGWQSITTLQENFQRLTQEQAHAHIHGVCSLTDADSLFIRHNAFQVGVAQISAESTHGFRHFLKDMPLVLDSMLPRHRMGLGFDQVQFGHYANPLG